MSEVKRLNIDSALAEWPASERPASEWDEQAERIQARITAGSSSGAVRQEGSGSSLSATIDIFEAPSPATPEEVQHSAAPASGSPGRLAVAKDPLSSGPRLESKMQTTERERDRKSLQDLARLASASSLTPLAPKVSSPTITDRTDRPVEAKHGDSGIVDLKMMAKADPKAEERAKTTPLATAELFDDDGRPSDVPALAPAASASAQKVVPMVAPAVAAVAPRAAASGSKSNPWYAIGGVAAVAAIAAAAVLMLRSPHQDGAVATVTIPPVTTPAPDKASGTPKTAVTANQPEAVAQAETKPQPSAVAVADDGVDVTKLPFAETVKPMQKHPVGGGVAVAGPTPPAPGKDTAVATAKPKPIDPKLIAKDLPASPDQNGTLNDALKQAAGAQDSNATPTPAATGAAFAAGSVPQKPSQGAVTGALGAVMPTVRACLQPDDPISRATVVFDSSGTVTSITVTGAAAGKPSEACIKSALAKAKVQPFAQPTYAANVTIRPN